MKSRLYGKLKGGSVVKVSGWISGIELTNPENEIYFRYTRRDRRLFGKQIHWAYGKDFIGFSKNKRGLRKVK